MFLIQVKLIEGVFTGPQKREIVERLTDALVAIEGENMRQAPGAWSRRSPSGEWGVGGQTLSADDVRALARGTDERAAERHEPAEHTPASAVADPALEC